MNYLDYIDSLQPREAVKERTMRQADATKRSFLPKRVTAVLAAAFLSQSPEKRTVPATQTTTRTPQVIEFEMQSDTVKSMPPRLHIDGCDYFLVHRPDFQLIQEELKACGALQQEALTENSMQFEGARVYRIPQEKYIVLQKDGKYYLFIKSGA